MRKNNKEIFNFDLSSLSGETGKQPSLDVKKYINLIWQKKYWIILICLVTTITWIILFTQFQDRFTKYTTYAVIRFDDPRYSRGISAVTDFTAGIGARSKATILNTKSFLARVVDSLNLNLIVVTSGIDRTKFFKKVEIQKDAKYGEYSITKAAQDSTYNILYQGHDTNEEIIQTIQIRPDSACLFQANGITLAVDTDILRQFDKVKLIYFSKPIAINHLRELLQFKLDRTQTVLSLSFSHKDPEFTAHITNKIAQLFILQLLEYKKIQTTSILKSLEEQLRIAHSELTISEVVLREFRVKNPRVFLNENRHKIIADLAENETSFVRGKRNKAELTKLIDKKNSTIALDSKHYIYLEILSYLESQDVPGSSIFKEEYRKMIDERDKLLNDNYSLTHPFISEANQKLENLHKEIDSRILKYMDNLKSNIAFNKSTINSFDSYLRNLPRRELKLAELERNHQIKENIASNILMKYNEAKVADAAVIPDAYIIDSALPPIVKSKGILSKLKMYSIGSIFGIFLGITIVIFRGIFDKRIWTQEEIEEKLNLPVLATIPSIKAIKDGTSLKKNDIIEPKLIGIDCAPTVTSEIFRRLRTVLQLNEDTKVSPVLIGSLNPNEGKSLISANLAITYAQKKHSTIIIDGDIRKGTLHNSFACKKEPGLTDLLLEDNLIQKRYISKFIQETHVPNLLLISSGNTVSDPSEVLGSARMKQFYDYIEGKFEKIIIDTPPFGCITDLFILNMTVHKIIIILRSESTNLSYMVDNLKEFSDARDDIIGVIINDSNNMLKRESYYKYSYYSY